MRYFIILGIFFIGFSGCTTNDSAVITDTTSVNPPSISGDIIWTYTGNDVDVTNKAPNTGSRALTLGQNSSISIKFSRNLSGMPFNFEMTIKIDKDNPNSDELYFISDFERPMFEGENYRLITTSVLAPGIAFVNGNTAGYVNWSGTQWGVGFGAVTEIIIAPTDNLLDNTRKQKITLNGLLVQDGNQKSSVEVGTINIQIDGDDMVDTTFF